jgi:hypothetical protein
MKCGKIEVGVVLQQEQARLSALRGIVKVDEVFKAVNV